VAAPQNDRGKLTNVDNLFYYCKAPCYKDLLEGIIKKWDLENLTSFLIRYNIPYSYRKWRNYTLRCFARLFHKKAKTTSVISLDKRVHYAAII
jgi:hypothetical protein